MKLKIGFGVLLSSLSVTVVGYAAVGTQRPDARTSKQDRTPTKIETVQALVEQAWAESKAAITVDVENATFLGLTLVNRGGDVMRLDFVPNETADAWTPQLTEGATAESFGADLHAWFPPWLMAPGDAKAQNKIELQPLDSSIADVPLDDLSVFVVNEDLVLIGLFDRGQIVGAYYAVNMHADVEGLKDADAPTPKRVVCGILYDTCVGQKDTYWVFACGLWLYLCPASS